MLTISHCHFTVCFDSFLDSASKSSSWISFEKPQLSREFPSQRLFSTAYPDAPAASALRVWETSSSTVSVASVRPHRGHLSQWVFQNFSLNSDISSQQLTFWLLSSVNRKYWCCVPVHGQLFTIPSETELQKCTLLINLCNCCEVWGWWCGDYIFAGV